MNTPANENVPQAGDIVKADGALSLYVAYDGKTGAHILRHRHHNRAILDNTGWHHERYGTNVVYPSFISTRSYASRDPGIRVVSTTRPLTQDEMAPNRWQLHDPLKGCEAWLPACLVFDARAVCADFLAGHPVPVSSRREIQVQSPNATNPDEMLKDLGKALMALNILYPRTSPSLDRD